MQTTRRRVLVLVTTVVAGMTGIIATAPSAFAGTVAAPTGNPFVVAGNASGQPQPFTVTASGYGAGSQVFIDPSPDNGFPNFTHAARMSQCQSAGTASIDFTGAGGASTLSIL